MSPPPAWPGRCRSESPSAVPPTQNAALQPGGNSRGRQRPMACASLGSRGDYSTPGLYTEKNCEASHGAVFSSALIGIYEIKEARVCEGRQQHRLKHLSDCLDPRFLPCDPESGRERIFLPVRRAWGWGPRSSEASSGGAERETLVLAVKSMRFALPWHV